MGIYWGEAGPWWFAWVAVGAWFAITSIPIDPRIVEQANNPGNF